jgi:hypothetical protein
MSSWMGLVAIALAMCTPAEASVVNLKLLWSYIICLSVGIWPKMRIFITVLKT